MRQRRRRHGLSALTLVLAMVAALSASASASVDTLTQPDSGEPELSRPEITRTTLTQGGDPSLVLDDLGNPIIAYTDHVDGVGGLRLLNCDDPACSDGGETIALLTDQADGNFTSMVLDDQGHPVIVYQGIAGASPNPGDLRMIRCNDPACAGGDDDVVILVSEGVSRFAKVRLDADGHPVVLYRSRDFGNFDVSDLHLLHCDDPVCAGEGDITSVLPFFDHKANGRPSFELDPSGRPVIAYSGQFDGLNGPSSMTLVQCNDVNCAGGDETTTFVGEGLSHPDLALVPNGDDYEIMLASVEFTFVASPRRWTFGLHVSTCPAADCEFTHYSFPDTLVDPPQTISLAISEGGPVIAYPRNRTLRIASLDLDQPAFYALRDVVSMAPDPDADGVIKPSMLLDRSGNAVVAYLADGGLNVLRCTNAGCIPTCNGLPLTIDFAAGDKPTPRPDVIRGTPGNDVIDGLGGNDVICGLGGDDVITGGDGFDKIFAGSGDDRIEGGTGNDRLIGGPGADEIDGGRGNDRLFGGPGNDRLSGSWGDDRLAGTGGNDIIAGGDGDDLLLGNLGRDTLTGGPGNDVLKGGAWIDSLDGGDGSDDRCGIVAGETRTNCERGVFGL